MRVLCLSRSRPSVRSRRSEPEPVSARDIGQLPAQHFLSLNSGFQVTEYFCRIEN